MSEKDLASKVVEWLSEQHWDVYQEVQFATYDIRADIVAVRSGLLWIIECKNSLSLSVLDQASRWRSHLRSVAVPQAKDRNGRKLACRIAKDYLKIGILEVNLSWRDIYESVTPPIMREYHRFSKGLMRRLAEEHKTYLLAGSNGGGYFTPYRQTMDAVKYFILDHPGCSLKDIMNHIEGHHHYSSDRSAKSCIRNALMSWETDWCRVDTTDKIFRYYIQNQSR